MLDVVLDVTPLSTLATELGVALRSGDIGSPLERGRASRSCNSGSRKSRHGSEGECGAHLESECWRRSRSDVKESVIELLALCE